MIPRFGGGSLNVNSRTADEIFAEHGMVFSAPLAAQSRVRPEIPEDQKEPRDHDPTVRWRRPKRQHRQGG